MDTKNSTHVMGIDPGSNVTGYGIVCRESSQLKLIDYGCIRPRPSFSPPEKREAIFESLSHLLDQYSPSAVSIETQFMRHNVHTAMMLGMIRGVAILAATLKKIPIYEYAPARAKKAVTGQGRASKIQVQAMVKQLLHLKEIPTPDDAGDALALAICHLQTNQLTMSKG